jgi:hypothetical protein
MAKKLFIVISLLLLFVLGAKNFIYNFFNIHRFGTYNDCGLTEWLINYQGGFIRRGISGEIFYQFSKIFFISANDIWLIVTCSSYLYLFYYLVRRTKNKFRLELIISPIILGMPIYTNFLWKKDIFQLLLFLLTLLIIKKNSNVILKIIVINFLCIVALLNHESFIFYAVPSLFIISLFLWEKKNILILKLLKSFLSFLPIFITILIIFYATFSDLNLTQKTLNIIQSWNPLWLQIEGRLPNDLGCFMFVASNEDGISINYKLPFFLEWYSLSWIALILISFYCCIQFTTKYSLSNKINLSKILLSQLIFLLPLFYLGGDWSRWIFFWVISSLMIHLEFKNYNLYNIIIYRKFINNLLNLKIFNFIPSCWLLFFIGFPYINYFISDFLDYMWVTPIGKIMTGSYKLLVWVTKSMF